MTIDEKTKIVSFTIALLSIDMKLEDNEESKEGNL